jgi:hypothetical protein
VQNTKTPKIATTIIIKKQSLSFNTHHAEAAGPSTLLV